ncbi:hypothetical protein FACS189485_20410 [Spirochaetia bacterium]|nr:hypothetical protein FACS189485_20410 [Spirochaetia bacterium]
MEWFFDGFGTAIVTFILGIISGGAIGYNIAIHKSNKQKQKARDNSSQFQIGEINNGR